MVCSIARSLRLGEPIAERRSDSRSRGVRETDTMETRLCVRSRSLPSIGHGRRLGTRECETHGSHEYRRLQVLVANEARIWHRPFPNPETRSPEREIHPVDRPTPEAAGA